MQFCRPFLPLLAALALLIGCAGSTPAPRTVGRARRQRVARTVAQPVAPASLPSSPERGAERRRDAGAMDARTMPSGSFGSPVLSARDDAGTLTARWSPMEGRARVRCEGDGPVVIPSTQSPHEPVSAMIVRAFLPAEAAVLACRPPVDGRGRLAVHALFHSNGAPAEVTFPAGISRSTGLCLGAALCGVRMPAFRAATAAVDYEYLLAIAR